MFETRGIPANIYYTFKTLCSYTQTGKATGLKTRCFRVQFSVGVPGSRVLKRGENSQRSLSHIDHSDREVNPGSALVISDNNGKRVKITTNLPWGRANP